MVRLVGSQEIIKTNLSKHQQIHQQIQVDPESPEENYPLTLTATRKDH